MRIHSIVVHKVNGAGASGWRAAIGTMAHMKDLQVAVAVMAEESASVSTCQAEVIFVKQPNICSFQPFPVQACRAVSSSDWIEAKLFQLGAWMNARRLLSFGTGFL